MSDKSGRAARGAAIRGRIAKTSGPGRLAIAMAALFALPAMADPVGDWMNSCAPYQQARQASNGATFGSAADNDPYLQAASTKDVSTPNPFQAANGISVGNFSCNGTVKSVFDSFLTSAGSMFGIDLGSLIGGMAGTAAGNVCGDVNAAIGKTFGGMNLNCPNVSIPGFNNYCHVGLNASANGISVTGSGGLGGYTTNASAGNGGVTYNGSTSNGSSASTGSNGTSSFGSISSSVSCWFTGSC